MVVSPSHFLPKSGIIRTETQPKNNLSSLLNTPLINLSFEDAIDLLISMGCPTDLETNMESLRGEFDGGFLYHIKDEEEFNVECKLSSLRKPTVRKIFSNLESLKREGVPKEIVLQFRTYRAKKKK